MPPLSPVPPPKSLVLTFECPVCLEEVAQEPWRFPCGHGVCQECFAHLKRYEGLRVGHNLGQTLRLRCPLCRESVDVYTAEDVWLLAGLGVAACALVGLAAWTVDGSSLTIHISTGADAAPIVGAVTPPGVSSLLLN